MSATSSTPCLPQNVDANITVSQRMYKMLLFHPLNPFDLPPVLLLVQLHDNHSLFGYKRRVSLGV